MTEANGQHSASYSSCYLSAALILLSTLTAAADDVPFKPRKVIDGNRFKAITEFPIVSATEAELGDAELVIGVVVDGQARAYPINMLTGPRREILNDRLGGSPIAATW